MAHREQEVRAIEGVRFLAKNGEIDPKRPYGEGKKADHTGQYWIGTFEKLLDKPTRQSARPTTAW